MNVSESCQKSFFRVILKTRWNQWMNFLFQSFQIILKISKKKDTLYISPALHIQIK